MPLATIRPFRATRLRQVGRDAVQVVGGQHDRDAVLMQVGEQVQHVVPRRDVDAGRRFVQQQQLGLAQQGPGDEHALLLPAGELADVPSGKLGNAQPVEDLLRPRRASAAIGHGSSRRACAPSARTRDGHREVPVHRLELRHVADAQAGRRLDRTPLRA